MQRTLDARPVCEVAVCNWDGRHYLRVCVFVAADQQRLLKLNDEDDGDDDDAKKKD